MDRDDLDRFEELIITHVKVAYHQGGPYVETKTYQYRFDTPTDVEEVLRKAAQRCLERGPIKLG